MKLFVFDLDETLFSHDYEDFRVYVRDSADNKIVQEISWVEYAECNNRLPKLPCGYEYDFHDFECTRKFEENARPIPTMIGLLNCYSNQPGAKVEILTARADFTCQKSFSSFMDRHGIDIHRVHVRRAGNLSGDREPPERKKEILKEQIGKYGYKEVVMFDDNINNLNAFLTLQQDFPESKFTAYHVDHTKEHFLREVDA